MDVQTALDKIVWTPVEGNIIWFEFNLVRGASESPDMGITLIAASSGAIFLLLLFTLERYFLFLEAL